MKRGILVKQMLDEWLSYYRNMQMKEIGQQIEITHENDSSHDVGGNFVNKSSISMSKQQQHQQQHTVVKVIDNDAEHNDDEDEDDDDDDEEDDDDDDEDEDDEEDDENEEYCEEVSVTEI